jgi:hypothetical protein
MYTNQIFAEKNLHRNNVIYNIFFCKPTLVLPHIFNPDDDVLNVSKKARNISNFLVQFNLHLQSPQNFTQTDIFYTTPKTFTQTWFAGLCIFPGLHHQAKRLTGILENRFLVRSII